VIHWQFYPRSSKVPVHLAKVIDVFKKHAKEIDSTSHDRRSNDVLALLSLDLKGIGFRVESGRRATDRIHIPVLLGRDGSIEKSFAVDAFHEKTSTVLEIEAGRGYMNHQFLKDFFEACAMQGVDYLVIGMRNVYKKNPDFERADAFFDTLYVSGRLAVPLRGLLLIGY
jgi:hypothetical protein